MRLLGSLVTLVLVSACAAPAVARSVRPATFGTVLGQVVSDGARWAAWSPDDHTTRILDTQTGTLTDVPTPQNCRPTDNINKGVTAIGGGQLAWTCTTTGTTATYPTLLTLRTMRVHLPAGLKALLTPRYTECHNGWNAVGARWVRGLCSGHRDSYPIDLNWHSGTNTFTTPPFDRHQTLSLDTQTRKTAVCRPILVARRRTEHGIRAIDRTRGVTVGDGWVLGQSPDRTRLQLQACSSRKVHVLERCLTACGHATLGDGWVSWKTANAAYTRRLHRRTLGPRVTLTSSRGTSALISAGRIVFAARLPTTPTQAVTTLRLWRLPGAPVLPPP